MKPHALIRYNRRMVKDIDIVLRPEEMNDGRALRRIASKKLSISSSDVSHVTVLRRSIDARRRDIKINERVRVYAGEDPVPEHPFVFPSVHSSPSAVVVGAGPAGLFAALTLIENGIRPIILERGKDVHSRRIDTAALSRDGKLNPESNYAFGEGGAGAYSDGKLYTRSLKRGDAGKILRLLVQHGADESILYDSHPHIGSDRLPKIIENIRNTIISSGGEVRFSSRVTGLMRKGDEVTGAVLESGEEISGPVILATGHSAKDVYSFLADNGFSIEAKSTAVGVRLEQPQALIDSIQYHSEKRSPFLPPASYSFKVQIDGRSVYSFCMCPGGSVVPASTEEGLLVINGMSPASRRGRWANSGMITEIRKEEIAGDDPFRVLRYIESIERSSFIPGFIAPAERMTDFCYDRPSGTLPDSTYRPGLSASRLDDILPPVVVSSLRQGFLAFSDMTRGRFLTEEGTVIACETRTSSPVRILRDGSMRQGRGLYPAGEGAGYAGGIVSAAIDGTEAALCLRRDLNG